MESISNQFGGEQSVRLASSRLTHRVGRDLSLFAKQAKGLLGRSSVQTAPGLHTYRFTPDGGTLRLHLRVEPDGNGVLFVDVTEVIHLSATATVIAKLLLDGTRREEVILLMQRHYSGATRRQLQEDCDRISKTLSAFIHPTNGCRTCAAAELSEPFERCPLFSTRARAPYKADLAITYACNNECPHCYNEPDRFDLESLPLGEWKQVIDRLVEVGVPHLILTGGEATLHPDLPDIICHADKAGPIVGLNTNGRRIAHHPYMVELAAAGLNHVQVTLESVKPEVHDAMVGATAWKQTVKGIETAQQTRVHTITNTTLTRPNANHVEETIEFLHSLGIRTFAMNGMIYSGGGNCNPDAIPEQMLPPILVRVRDKAAELGMKFLWYTPTEYCRMSPVELEIGAKRCNAAEYSICIEPNGDVLPCQSFYTSGGNLLRDPWERIWNSDLFRSFREREEDPRAAGLPEMCWECPDLPLCGGGCRIEREARDNAAPSDCAICSGNGCAVPSGGGKSH
ncbi:MAG: radical SAM protein [Armatimonadetes bacterium]|nr:radical SAM protein [Armatimonadota bacterium]